jgi:hypothetical protein
MKTDCIKSVGCNTYEGLDGLNNIRSSKTRNDKEDGGLLRFNKHKHWSPLQHIFFSFKVTTTRAIRLKYFVTVL